MDTPGTQVCTSSARAPHELCGVDVFIYGNRKSSSPGPEVVLPIMCAKALGESFSIAKSDFRMQSSKAGMWLVLFHQGWWLHGCD